MPRWFFQLVILIAVFLAICLALLPGKGDQILSYCCSEDGVPASAEPEFQPSRGARLPASPPSDPERGLAERCYSLSWLLGVGLAGIFLGFLLAVLFGAMSSHDKAAVKKKMKGIFDDRKTEAKLHGLGTAKDLIEKAEADLATALIEAKIIDAPY